MSEGNQSNGLTFSELRTTNLARCNRWHPAHSWSLSDWFTAAMGELGEAANIAKKLNRIRDMIIGNNEGETREKLEQDLKDEIADTVIYLDLLCASQNIDLEQAVRDKFNRTSVKHGFSDRL